MSAPAMRANARPRSERAQNQSKYAQEFGGNALRVSSDELLSFNSRFGGGCADLP
jgi:hypothetical protein